MIIERLKIFSRSKPQKPSKELLGYIKNAWNGTNKDIPTHGLGVRGIFDYYGRSEEGNERARFRIPWGEHEEIEKSYYIERKANGEIVVTPEGFYPYKG